MESNSPKTPAFYPEGPYIYKGVLHWVEYTKNTVCNEAGMRHELPYYGPCGLASFKGELVVACYDSHLIYFMNSGITIDIPYPNDMIEDDKGGLFITSSATNTGEEDPFKVDAVASGGIYYLDKDNGIHKLLLDRPIHYANGITYDGTYIYVSEHLKNRVLKYEISYDKNDTPVLGGTQIHIPLTRNLSEDALLGPDGLCSDKRGNMYIAHFGSGKLLVYNDQRLVDTYEVDHSYITNVCMLDEGHVCITVANGGEAGYVGRIGLKK